MALTGNQIKQFATVIEHLYEHVFISDIPQNAPYQVGLPREQQFALDNEGYYVWYVELLRAVFVLPGSGDTWSEQAIKDKIHALLIDLSHIKAGSPALPDFLQIAQEWTRKIDIQFEEKECYVPVIGLAVEKPITIGDITFWPIDIKKRELEGKVDSSFFDDLASSKDCVACATIRAEIQRSTEILRSKTEDALNILRYIGSLVWHSQPIRHMYVVGQQRKRISYALSIDSNGNVNEIGDTLFTPLPFKIDDEFIQHANFYGLAYFQSLLNGHPISSLEQSLLTAIHWFGDATQDLIALFSFVKFYISLEVVAKKKDERAKATLPKRISVLLEPRNQAKQRKLEVDLKVIIDERNAVFHNGRPEHLSVEYLAWASRNLVRGTINQLRLRINSEGLQTKDDLIYWVKNQYDTYLR